MPPHRGFTLRKFARDVGTEWLGLYFQSCGLSPNHEDEFSSDGIVGFLEELETKTRMAILEDFRRTNDVADKAQNLLVEACSEAEIEFPDDWPFPRISIRLFLEHREIFECAHGQFRMLRIGDSFQVHRFQTPPPEWNLGKIPDFTVAMSDYFQRDGKGPEVEVIHYELDGALWLLIGRGAYIQTQQIWDGAKQNHQIFRPVREDVIRIQNDPAAVFIKVYRNHAATVHAHLSALGKHILGIPSFGSRLTSDSDTGLVPYPIWRILVPR